MFCSENAVKLTALSITEWQARLGQLLLPASKRKVVFIGVGNPLRGDDYVGSYVVKELIKHVPRNSIKVDFFDAEDSVESVITKVIQINPEHVIFIDSCEMHSKPGEIRLVSVSETDYPFFTTHGIPLKVLAERLLPESKAWVLAVQPKQVEFGEEMSPEVDVAGILISHFILERLLEED